jgi:hypothetical protein
LGDFDVQASYLRDIGDLPQQEVLAMGATDDHPTRLDVFVGRLGAHSVGDIVDGRRFGVAYEP